MTPEGKLKKQVKALLDELGAYYFMPVQTGYGAQGLDFFCCIRGRFVAIETKAPGKKPTLRQEFALQMIFEAGGISMWSDNIEKIHDYLSYHFDLARQKA